MEATNSLERVQHKANTFKVLSVLYKQPSEDFHYYLTHLKISISNIYPQLLNDVEKLEFEFQKYDTKLINLEVEHAKLFVGPFDVLCPPYSSIYLNEGRAVFGESTLEAINAYNEAGIELSKEYKELPDHISTELEFIYFLYFSYHDNPQFKYLQQIESFIESHLGR